MPHPTPLLVFALLLSCSSALGAATPATPPVRAATAAISGDAPPQKDLDQALLKAAEHRVPDEVRHCLESGANPKVVNDFGDQPLHIAVRRHDRRSAALLLRAGADVNAVTSKMVAYTPLHLAAMGNDPAMCDLLLTAGAKVEPLLDQVRGRDTPIAYALANHQHAVVRRLLAAGARPHTESRATPQTGEPQNRLILAARDNDLADMKTLLAADGGTATYAHWNDGSGRDPLDTAIENGHLEMVELLLAHLGEIQVQPQDRLLQQALLVAAENGRHDVLRRMFKAGARADAADYRGWSLLHTAADKGDADLVKFLLESGARADARTQHGWQPLHAAVQRGHAKIAALLLEAGAPVDAAESACGRTPLHVAALCSRADMAELLLAHHANVGAVDMQGNQPLHEAAAAGDRKIVKLLLKAGANPTAIVKPEGRGILVGASLEPIHLAAMEGRTDVLDLLLAAGAKVDARCNAGGDQPIHLAARAGHADMVRALLKHGAKADAPSTTPSSFMHRVSDGGDTVGYELGRLSGGVAEGTRNAVNPLIHQAADAGHAQVVKVLLDAGIPADTLNGDNLEPLQVAVARGNTEVVETLLAAHANPNVLNPAGNGPLWIAAMSGYTETARALLKGGAKVDRHGTRSRSPLAVAVQMGHLETAKLLAGAGADLRAKTPDGLPLYDLAMRHRQFAAAQWLADSDARRLAAQKAARETADQASPWMSGERTLEGNLWSAATGGDEKRIRALLAAGAKPGAVKYLRNETPLHQAAAGGFAEVATLLLDAGAQPDIANDYGYRPVQVAAERGHADLVKLLAARGADLDTAPKPFLRPLGLAIKNGRIAAVQALLTAGADPNAPCGEVDPSATPLHLAAANGDVAMVEALVKAGAKVDAVGRLGEQPLHAAARNGRTEAVRALLKAGAKADAALADGSTPVLLAAMFGKPCFFETRRYTDTVKVLLAAGAAPEVAGPLCQQPLYHAVTGKNLEMAQMLLKAGAGLDAPKTPAGSRDAAGRALMREAQNTRYADMIEFLKAAGAKMPQDATTPPVNPAGPNGVRQRRFRPR